MTRKPLISGNWKMNLNHFEAIQCVQKLSYLLTKDDYAAVDVSVHPPFTDIRSVQTVIDADELLMQLGAQHCHWEEKGAYTGEVAPAFLAKLNVKYVIVGHSERRELFGETDEMVNKKVAAVFANGMTPIMCVGETLEERESGVTETVLARQLDAVADLLASRVPGSPELVVAYEPVWAIGTGRTASPEQAQAVHAFLRARAGAAGASLRILYGGSVKAGNAASLFAMPDIDGGLIGGAALVADDFLAICRAAAGTTESHS